MATPCEFHCTAPCGKLEILVLPFGRSVCWAQCILFSFKYFLMLCIMVSNRAIASSIREESSACSTHVSGKTETSGCHFPLLLWHPTCSVMLLWCTCFLQSCLQRECPFSDKPAFKCHCPTCAENYKVPGEPFVHYSCSEIWFVV